MKILTINWTYKYGSTGKLICDIEQELPQCEFYHCYEYQTVGTAANAYCLTSWFWSHVHNRTSRLKGLQYCNGVAPTRRLIRKIESYQPDMIHMHCPNGSTLDLYRLLSYIKKSGIPLVITNHAEFFYTGNCAYAYDCTQYLTGCRACPRYKDATNSYVFNRAPYAWKKMRAALQGFEKLQMVCVSPWQEKRLRESVLCHGLASCVIGNGIDTKIFCPKPEKSRESGGHSNVRGTEERFTLLQVTSSFSDDSDDIKGGRYLIELARRLGAEYEIRVAGSTHPLRNGPLPANITLLGNLSDQRQLAEEYRKADLVVLTSKKETFGMACAESLCCGTPVAGFLCGGTESIALPEYTGFCEFGNVDALQELVQLLRGKKRGMSEEEKRAMTEAAATRYSKETMAEAYYRVYEKLGSIGFDRREHEWK
jgi:glycosyltransferase involved in cell wall biosynthesis